MQTVQEIKDIADSRIQEATLLHNNGFYDASIYLAGYSIELILKAKICQILDIPDFFHQNSGINRGLSRGFKTHDLEDLIVLSGLKNKFQLAKGNNRNLMTNWSIICEWSENKRYCACGTCNVQESLNFLQAITDSTNGIKSWIENN